MLRTCIKCGEGKDPALFTKQGNVCKKCTSLYQKKYREENRIKISEGKSLYYSLSENILKKKNKDKQYYLDNIEKILYYQKEYRKNNSEKISKYLKEYSLLNREKVNTYKKTYKKRNPGKVQSDCVFRRSKKLQATPAWRNTFFIEEIYRLANLRSRVTGIKWEVDHIIPLISNLVCGLHWENNLQVVPSTYNNKKGNRFWPDMP